MSLNLNSLLNLLKKTKDKVIIVNELTGESCVIMSLSQYEKMQENPQENNALTGEKLIDKINSDIANWKEEEAFVEESKYPIDNYDNEVDDEHESPEENYNNSEDEIYRPGTLMENIRRKNWRIPRERKVKAVEVVEDEKQYLEDLPF